MCQYPLLQSRSFSSCASGHWSSYFYFSNLNLSFLAGILLSGECGSVPGGGVIGRDEANVIDGELGGVIGGVPGGVIGGIVGVSLVEYRAVSLAGYQLACTARSLTLTRGSLIHPSFAETPQLVG